MFRPIEERDTQKSLQYDSICKIADICAIHRHFIEEGVWWVEIENKGPQSGEGILWQEVKTSENFPGG